jgi:hypothetical protein
MSRLTVQRKDACFILDDPMSLVEVRRACDDVAAQLNEFPSDSRILDWQVSWQFSRNSRAQSE